MSAETYTYPGDELALFQEAVHWKAYLRQRLRPYIRGAVAEIGAGNGATTLALCDGRQASWLCLEPDEMLVATLQHRIAQGAFPLPPTARVGTLACLAPADRFDSILYVDVLEHIEQDRDELTRAAAHLNPGGRILVLSPAYPWLYTAFDKAIGHHRRYNRRMLTAVTPPGTTLERLFYMDAVGLLASSANRVLLRQGCPTRQQVLFWDRVLVRASRWVDPLFGHRIGRSIVALWRKNEHEL